MTLSHGGDSFSSRLEVFLNVRLLGGFSQLSHLNKHRSNDIIGWYRRCDVPIIIVRLGYFMQLLATFRSFFYLCLFRERPENLPASETLLLGVAAFYVLVQVISQPLSDLLTKLLIFSANALLLGAVWFFILQLRHLAVRWKQTATAMFGSLALTNLLAWPFNSDATESVLAVQSAMSDPAFVGDSPPGLFMAPGLAITAIFIWQLSIQASILRHAIKVHPAFCFIIVIGYTVVISVVLSGLLGPFFR